MRGVMMIGFVAESILFIAMASLAVASVPARLGPYWENLVRQPGSGRLAACVLVGLVAGWLAGQLRKGRGHRLIGDVLVGVVGGPLFSFVLPGSQVGLLGSLVIAFAGAAVLIALARALPRRSPA